MKNNFLKDNFIFDDEFYNADTRKTPERWIKAMKEFNVFTEFPIEKFTLFRLKNLSQLPQIIECKDILVNSLCSHHLFPFSCKIDIYYIPNFVYCGLSKLPRVANHYAKRPCSQEELVENIYNYLIYNLQPNKLKVVARDGFHTCRNSRGIEKNVNYTITQGAI